MNEEDNVVPFGPPQGGGQGGGDDTKKRLARIENELTHLAKREDIKDMEAKIMKWLLATLSAAMIAVLAALVRTFV